MVMTTYSACIADDSRPNPLGVLANKVSLMIFAVLMFLQWSPPGFYNWLTSFRWYYMVGIAGVIFILQSRHLKISNTRIYLVFSLLSWGGVLLSLFRTDHTDTTLYVLVSMTVPFALGLVLIPIFAHRKGKTIWLIALGGAAILWAYRTIRLWLTMGENLRYELVGSGVDHNMIALCMAIAATVLMVISFYSNFAVQVPVKNFIRALSFIASIGFLFCSFLTYSRSGFIVSGSGILFVVLTLILSRRLKTFFAITAFFLIGISLILPLLQITNPTWFIKFDEVSRFGDSNTTIYVRTVLAGKAWQIIKENPIIGIGPGSFRTRYDSSLGNRSFILPHNTYLGTWAEQGILGLASYIFWMLMWGRAVIKNWTNFDTSEKALMSVFVPFFLMLAFLDMNGILNISLLAFYSGLGAETKHA